MHILKIGLVIFLLSPHTVFGQSWESIGRDAFAIEHHDPAETYFCIYVVRQDEKYTPVLILQVSLVEPPNHLTAVTIPWKNGAFRADDTTMSRKDSGWVKAALASCGVPPHILVCVREYTHNRPYCAGSLLE